MYILLLLIFSIRFVNCNEYLCKNPVTPTLSWSPPVLHVTARSGPLHYFGDVIPHFALQRVDINNDVVNDFVFVSGQEDARSLVWLNGLTLQPETIFGTTEEIELLAIADIDGNDFADDIVVFFVDSNTIATYMRFGSTQWNRQPDLDMQLSPGWRTAKDVTVGKFFDKKHDVVIVSFRKDVEGTISTELIFYYTKISSFVISTLIAPSIPFDCPRVGAAPTSLFRSVVNELQRDNIFLCFDDSIDMERKGPYMRAIKFTREEPSVEVQATADEGLEATRFWFEETPYMAPWTTWYDSLEIRVLVLPTQKRDYVAMNIDGLETEIFHMQSSRGDLKFDLDDAVRLTAINHATYAVVLDIATADLDNDAGDEIVLLTKDDYLIVLKYSSYEAPALVAERPIIDLSAVVHDSALKPTRFLLDVYRTSTTNNPESRLLLTDGASLLVVEGTCGGDTGITTTLSSTLTGTSVSIEENSETATSTTTPNEDNPLSSVVLDASTVAPFAESTLPLTTLVLAIAGAVIVCLFLLVAIILCFVRGRRGRRLLVTHARARHDTLSADGDEELQVAGAVRVGGAARSRGGSRARVRKSRANSRTRVPSRAPSRNELGVGSAERRTRRSTASAHQAAKNHYDIVGVNASAYDRVNVGAGRGLYDSPFAPLDDGSAELQHQKNVYDSPFSPLGSTFHSNKVIP